MSSRSPLAAPARASSASTEWPSRCARRKSAHRGSRKRTRVENQRRRCFPAVVQENQRGPAHVPAVGTLTTEPSGLRPVGDGGFIEVDGTKINVDGKFTREGFSAPI